MKKSLFVLFVVLGLTSSLVAKEYTCTRIEVYDVDKNKVVKKFNKYEAEKIQIVFKDSKLYTKENKQLEIIAYKTTSSKENGEEVEYYERKIGIIPFMKVKWIPSKKNLKVGIIGLSEIDVYRCE